MWRILIPELKYNTGIMAIFFSIAVLLLLTMVDNDRSVLTYMAITMPLYYLTVISMGRRYDLEKRDRYYTIISVPQKQFSLARLCFLCFFQCCLLLLWILMYFAYNNPGDDTPLWTLLSFNAIVLMIMLLFPG